MTYNTNESQNSYGDNDIDLKLLLKSLLRGKKLIFIFTGITTAFTIFLVNNIKPTWIGSFNIVVKDENKTASPLDGFDTATLLVGGISDSNKTQELILRSPSVLMPVFEFMKGEHQKLGLKDIKNISFDSWLKKYLNIGFQKGTSVLNIQLKNKDKQLILDTLSMISSKYKDYSKKDKEKNLEKAITYLQNQQVIMFERSKNSTKNLNQFSIENGLGNIDGFVELGKPNTYLNINNNPQAEYNKFLISQGDLSMQNNLSPSKANISETAGQRFNNQFRLLETYESEYTDLSSKLKPNSKTLKNRKIKIDNLRASLKRPNEILIKYKELKNEAQLNENLLYRIEIDLAALKLEKVKTPNTWEMISLPTINKDRYFPKRLKLSIFALFASFITSSLFIILKERLSDKLFEKNSIEKKLKCKYLDTLYDSNFDISKKIFNKIIKDNIDPGKNVGLINFKNKENLTLIEKLIKENKNLLNIKISDEISISKCSKLILIIEANRINTKEVNLINKYINLYQNNFIGWIYLEKKIDLSF